MTWYLNGKPYLDTMKMEGSSKGDTPDTWVYEGKLTWNFWDPYWYNPIEKCYMVIESNGVDTNIRASFGEGVAV